MQLLAAHAHAQCNESSRLFPSGVTVLVKWVEDKFGMSEGFEFPGRAFVAAI